MSSCAFEPRGAYSQLEALLDCRHLAKDISLNVHHRALSQQLGQYASRSRGRGIDFDEVRVYQAGDDVRSIDWRVTARTGTAHTKLFHQELERPVMIACDQRLNMFFGSKNCFKSVLATHAAATLAWAAWLQGDRLGASIFSTVHQELRPKASRAQVLAFLKELNQANRALQMAGQGDSSQGQNYQSLDQHLKQLTRLLKPGSAVFIISDFCDFSDNSIKYLHQLKKHNDVIALHIVDPMEQELPLPGLYQVSDGSSRVQLNTSGKKQRQSYRQAFQQRQQNLQQALQKLGIACFELNTAQALEQALKAIFARPAMQVHSANKVGR